MKKFTLLVFILVIFAACGRGNNGDIEHTQYETDEYYNENISELPTYVPENENVADVSGELSITFEFMQQEGWATNQFAVWVEDMSGRHVHTLFATDWGYYGGFGVRGVALPVWLERIDADALSDAELAAFVSPVPDSGTLSFSWDLTDAYGSGVTPGYYRFIVEGNIRWANRIMFEGVVDTSGDFAIAWAEAMFFHEEDEQFPALTEIDIENYMITDVTAVFSR